jgi:glycosyltransferase involved in cell wall biosynthesis
VRILLLNQHYAPDEVPTAQLLADLGESLAAAGHDVRAVCTRRDYADPSRSFPRRETLRGVRVTRTPGPGFGRLRRAGRLLDYGTYLVGAMLVAATAPRPDVVISLSTPPMLAVLGWLAARARGGRAVYWVMDLYPDVAFELGVLRRRSFAGRWLQGLSRRVLRGSDAVVALGETMARHLGDAGASNVHVVHNWVDGEAIRPVPRGDNRLREAWGWTDRFVVLYSGNLGLAHEFDTVLDAAERLRDRPRILFAFVGQGVRRAEVEAGARARGLDNVVFRPYVSRDDLGESLSAGDLHLITLRPNLAGLLLPSKIYGVLAAGRPTLYIGPGDCEIAGMVREGRCGRRFAQGDAESLARTIADYASDPARCEAEGRRARELFADRFTRGRAMRAFADLLGGSR